MPLDSPLGVESNPCESRLNPILPHRIRGYNVLLYNTELCNAASIMLAHNHPSGDPTPSPADISVTRIIAESGKLLGIPLLDHIIIGSYGSFTSLVDKGYL